MAELIRMPLLSDTMTEGVISKWHKKVGDKVKADDVLADVETDKATMEINPYVDGTLLYVGVPEGKAAPVNGIIAIIGKDGEDIDSILAQEKTATTPKAEEPKSAPAPAAKTENAPTPKVDVSKIDATVIRMPLLSDTMTEGKIVNWEKNVGDKVKSDDVLAEVETDKATMEINPYVDGTLLYVGVKAGEAAKVNSIIAIIGIEGTDVTPLLDNDNTATSTNNAAAENKESESNDSSPEPVNIATASNDDDILKASPLAKKIAKDKNIDLHNVTGSGDGGRIIKRDIENYTPTAATAKASTPPTVGTQVINNKDAFTDIPLTQMRKTIARRLSESMFTAPHFYLTISVKMDKAMEARTAMNEISASKISFNDFVIKASASALKLHPEVNSSWMGDNIRQNNYINIGSAVALPEGLIVPVIKNADLKSLSEIAAETKELVKKARDKKIQPNEFTGNTFSISNLGMMDIDEFTAIINPPDSAILAVGKIEPTPVVENASIVIRQIMKLTLSCDHRVIDGALGANFLKTLKGYLENPVTMLV